jgi:nucleoside-diphosphate-sugar epimerase
MSMRKIREELGFEPRYGVAAAMAELEQWFRTGTCESSADHD